MFIVLFYIAYQGQSWSRSAACLHGSYHDICEDSVIFPGLYSSVWWTRLCELQQFEETCHSVHYSKWYLDNCSLPLHDSHWKNTARLHGEWQNSSKEEVTLKWPRTFYCLLTVLIPGNFFSVMFFLEMDLTINTSNLC